MPVLNLTFDGVTPIVVDSQTEYTWNGGYLGMVSLYGESPDPLTANITVDGEGWFLSLLRLGGASRAVVKDVGGTQRYIDVIWTGDNGSSLALNSTVVKSFVGLGGNDAVTISGTARVENFNLGDGDNYVRTGGQFVVGITAFSGKDTVVVGEGGAGSISLGDGDNTIVTTSGWVSGITTYDGNDRVTVGVGGVGVIHLEAGNNVVTTIGHADAVVMRDGNDTVNVGNGGVGYIELGSGANRVTAQGFVEAISGGDEFDRITIGLQGAGSVRTRDGNDVIDTKAGFVDLISSGFGADRVMLGAGGARVVSLFWGDDTLILSRLTDHAATVALFGGEGRDALNLSAFGGNFDILAGRLFDTGAGSFVQTGFETIVAGRGANNFVGDAASNNFFGGAGNDRLDGGLGNDVLRGEAGADAFLFTTAPSVVNRDVVVDFNRAQRDTIQLDSDIFARLGDAGRLNAQFFRLGASAADANDYIVYNRATGQLFYDADGNGSNAAQLIATLSNKFVVNAADFLVI